ncbi:hypothetical protein MMPV_009154 [Pyropia vietnamensis]
MAAYVSLSGGPPPTALPTYLTAALSGTVAGGASVRRPPRVVVTPAAVTRAAVRFPRSEAAAVPAPRQSVRMGVPAAAGAAALLLAEDIYGQIALGGVAIIASGVVGALITGWLINRNYDALEAEFRNRDAGDYDD